MNRFDREHVDGIGDGLSIASGIVKSSRTLEQATKAITEALLKARAAKDRANMAELTELASAPSPHAP